MNNNKCHHCGEEIIQEFQLKAQDGLKTFCCQGCLSVYQILNMGGLSQFYQIKDSTYKKPLFDILEFDYLDQAEFREKYLGDANFSFYVEGVHCLACIWVLEKLPELNKGVISSHLNMGTGVLQLKLREDHKLSEIAHIINKLGYRPHPLMQTSDAKKLEEKENRRTLTKISIAFFSAGNIMLYSIAVYAGAEGQFKNYFNLFSFFCAIPVYVFCAIPFYKSALSSIRTRRSSIDQPIVLAVIISFILGVYSFIFKKDFFYFDTISILIFLLLVTRYTLSRIQKNYLNKFNMQNLFDCTHAKKITDKGTESILASLLKKDDHVLVGKNNVIPVDGVVTKGSGHINNSLLTGEVFPTSVNIGDEVFMGAKNLNCDLEIKVTVESSNTRLSKIFQEIESEWRKESKISALAESISRRFITTIFGLTIILFIYTFFYLGLEQAASRSLALILITCPCALALSTPLASILGLSILIKEGVIVKSEMSLEKIVEADTIIFDKTGTLTTGDFKVEMNEEFNQKNLSIAYHLESNSSHPIGRSITQFIQSLCKVDHILVKDWMEIPGFGVRGTIENDRYEMKAIDNIKQVKTIGLFKNGDLLYSFSLIDDLKEEAVESINLLKKLGFDPIIVSGDNRMNVETIAGKLGLKKYYFNVSPEEKVTILKKHKKAMMVGDGLNDALALKKAFVGIAVRGSVDVSLRAADVYLSKPDLRYMTKLILGARKIIKIIKMNVLFSLLYNLIGIYLACTGQVSPLVAAILMPISSLTVILFTLYSSRNLRTLIN